jgi:hypothetical protein
VVRLRSLLILMAAVCVVGATSMAQDDTAAARTGWQTNVILDLTATQVSYSDSWTGGEVGSFSWVSNLNASAEKKLAPWANLRSVLRLSYGQTLLQDDSTGDWQKPQKSTDLIDWETLVRYDVDWAADFYTAVRLESQFLDASVSAKKRYLSPLKLTESAGVLKKFYEKDKDFLMTRLGGALRQTFTTVITDMDQLTTERETATDFGFEWVTDAQLTLSEKLLYIGKLSLYKAVAFSESDEVEGTVEEDDWKAIDVNWENTVKAELSRIIAVNFYTQFLYDKQISKKGRFKETLGIGFVFKLM